MAVTQNAPAPYTAGAALINVIRRFREKGLTTPIGKDVLVRAGVSDALVPRTLQSLQVLDLVDDKGQPTEIFRRIRSVPEADYKATLSEWLNHAYSEVFTFVDPGKDDAVRVRDAFRLYVPHGQQDRMVALFLALCAEAGLVEDSKRNEAKLSARKSSRPAQAQRDAGKRVVQKAHLPAPPPVTVGASSGLHPALAGLLQSVPTGGRGWTQEVRDRFLETFGAVLDFAVPIVNAEPQGDYDEYNDEA